MHSIIINDANPKYVTIIEKNTVADNIPAPSARNVFPLPLQRLFDPTSLFPAGVANTHQRLML